MSEIVFFLEEPSVEAMLDGFLPKILHQDIQYRCVVFEGKQDLEKRIFKRIRGYRNQNAKFVVLRDQDAGNCRTIKTALAGKCAAAGHPGALVRIACYELESWYLADLDAVEKGLSVHGLVRLQNKRGYVSPDDFPSPSRLLKEIAPVYQKVSGSRAIGPHLNPMNRRSRSFGSFVDGLTRLTTI